MVLRGLALAFLLVLAPLLLARGQNDLGPKDSGGPMEAGKSGMHLSLPEKVLLFSPCTFAVHL